MLARTSKTITCLCFNYDSGVENKSIRDERVGVFYIHNLICMRDTLVAFAMIE